MKPEQQFKINSEEELKEVYAAWGDKFYFSLEEELADFKDLGFRYIARNTDVYLLLEPVGDYETIPNPFREQLGRKVNLGKKQAINVSDLTIADHVGFVDNFGHKGYFVYVGMDKDHKFCVHAVSLRTASNMCNTSHGNISQNWYTSIPKKFDTNYDDDTIVEMRVFDTIQDLHLWLSKK